MADRPARVQQQRPVSGSAVLDWSDTKLYRWSPKRRVGSIQQRISSSRRGGAGHSLAEQFGPDGRMGLPPNPRFVIQFLFLGRMKSEFTDTISLVITV